MAQTFYGKWIVEVVSKDASFDERFIISGAAVGNGAYAGVVGTSVHVEGLKWQISFEWTGPTHIDWRPSDDRKLSAGVLLDKGLVVTIGADDNVPAARDHDYNDLIVRCRNIDPQLNPFIPITTLPDFTYERRGRKPNR
jgi:hypothetical protein